jgi:hypothetical protein
MSYPTDPEFTAINITSEHSNLRSETRSGRTIVRGLGTQRWRFTAKYDDLTREQFAPVLAFVMSTKGGLDSFEIVPPVVSTSQNTLSGTPAVNGAHTAGDNTIQVDSFTGTLKAGDFIKFASHTKVYMVVADRSGVGEMTIEPALIEDVPNNNSITVTDVPFTMRLDNDIQQYRLNGYDRYQYQIDLIEVI